MLCELVSYFDGTGPFRLLQIWLVVTSAALVFIMFSSGLVFYWLYWPSNVTYEKWRCKSNPAYPSVEKVRDEIVQMLKGLCCSTIFPSLSIYLSATGSTSPSLTQGFCGWWDFSLGYHLFSLFVVWIGSDFYEFAYHRLGHVSFPFWKHHKHHHVFYNPSPFAVIADEWIDQFVRSLPVLLIPVLMPVNLDLLFVTYAVCFYFYGVYLHSGHELDCLSAHNKYINTSFQHYCHHAKSLMNKPYHCGFFIKLWDNLFSCVYPEDKCFCAECSRSKGERSFEAYEKVHVPDYSLLFEAKTWLGKSV
ncbi:uncharacterized protein LOC134840466 [Symsagittifera roscoffensis]|uniref:uncharacterized protein LOC134840466 n=1 Tax=Symsagittifera roscoffensis TaxID=84072 RepID=UPI00307CAE8B